MAKSKADEQVSSTITPALLLDIFDEPIVFQRAYVGLTGSAVAALFLSYAVATLRSGFFLAWNLHLILVNNQE